MRLEKYLSDAERMPAIQEETEAKHSDLLSFLSESEATQERIGAKVSDMEGF